MTAAAAAAAAAARAAAAGAVGTGAAAAQAGAGGATFCCHLSVSCFLALVFIFVLPLLLFPSRSVHGVFGPGLSFLLLFVVVVCHFQCSVGRVILLSMFVGSVVVIVVCWLLFCLCVC